MEGLSGKCLPDIALPYRGWSLLRKSEPDPLIVTCTPSGLNSASDWDLTPPKETRIGLRLEKSSNLAYFGKRTHLNDPDKGGFLPRSQVNLYNNTNRKKRLLKRF